MFLILIFQQFERQSSYAYQPEISNVMASITIGRLNKIDISVYQCPLQLLRDREIIRSNTRSDIS